MVLLNCWADGTSFSEKDKERIEALRKAGCRCELPLLGERPNVGPRCRVCNTQAYWKATNDTGN